MKTLFITFSVIIVIMFGGAIIAGDAGAKSLAIHIHDRATHKAPIVKVQLEVQTEIKTYSI